MHVNSGRIGSGWERQKGRGLHVWSESTAARGAAASAAAACFL